MAGDMPEHARGLPEKHSRFPRYATSTEYSAEQKWVHVGLTSIHVTRPLLTGNTFLETLGEGDARGGTAGRENLEKLVPKAQAPPLHQRYNPPVRLNCVPTNSLTFYLL